MLRTVTLRYAGALAVPLLCLGCENAPPIQPTPIPTSISARSFSLGGFVGDTAGRDLAGARVEVVDDRGAATVTTTDGHGHFSLPGPFTGTVRVTASHDGHLSQTKTYALPDQARTGAQGRVTFGLEAPGSSAQIVGNFTVTLTADASCTGLPDEGRARGYSTTITGDVRNGFAGRLSGARFFPWTSNCPGPDECLLDRFWLGTAGDYVGGYMSIIEQLSDTSYLIADGRISGSISSTGVTASLDGYLDFCRSPPNQVDQGTWTCPPASGTFCHSANHRIDLIRR